MTDKVATIVPWHHLNLIKNDVYFMALSYACDAPGYMQFFREMTRQRKYVILDNSAVEMGNPESFESYITKAIYMKATEILMPDYFREKQKTLDAMKPALETMRQMEFTGRVMAVPQGETPSDFLNCVAQMIQYPIHTLGISRRYINMFGGTRTGICEMVHDRLLVEGTSSIKVHLLGCWSHPVQDIGTLLREQYIQGIDGSLPSVFALHSQLLEEAAERPGPGIDIINDVYDRELLSRNIGAWQHLCWKGHRS